MKLAHLWLRDYVKSALGPEDLAERLRMTSSEVDEIESWEQKLSGLCVGKVMEVRPHPNASRLNIAMVDLGEGKLRQIVCGAPNLAQSQYVVVALPGTTIHPLKGEPITIKEAVIREETSAGMLCGPDEIGLPMQVDGILTLEPVEVGTPFAAHYRLNDTVLDVEVTPNRPDLLSYLGLAREVAAFEKKRLIEPPIAVLEEEDNRHHVNLEAEVDDSGLASRYCAISLEGITNGQSPAWLQGRLILAGIRPINLVVDITNYCMLEYGQPLHAFDLRSVAEASLRVRSARTNEKLVTLEGAERILEKGDIVIADGRNRTIALAGIMGGQGSAVSPSTTQIVLESAVFNGAQVRRTSRRLGLRSESSTRFEKGLDPELCVTALKRAVYLLQELGGAAVNSRLVDTYPQGRVSRPRIHLSFARIQQITGVHLSAADCKSILQHLGFQIPSLNKSSFEVIPPSWRQDVNIPEDVAEELLRIWGYDRLPSTMPVGAVRPPEPNHTFELKQRARRILAACGLNECVHLSFVSASSLRKSGLSPEQAVRLDYPLSQETEYLLPSHLPAFLNNLSSQNIKETEIGLFEIGKIFSRPTTERQVLSLILRTGKPAEELLSHGKSVILRLLRGLALISFEDSLELRPASKEGIYVSGSLLEVTVAGNTLGTVGILRPEIAQDWKIRSGRQLLFMEFAVDCLVGLSSQHRLYQPPFPFPSIERDLSLVVAADMPVARLEQAVAALIDSSLVRRIEVTTIYRGAPLTADQKSVTIHFNYASLERTLLDTEVNTDQERIAQACAKELQ